MSFKEWWDKLEEYETYYEVGFNLEELPRFDGYGDTPDNTHLILKNLDDSVFVNKELQQVSYYTRDSDLIEVELTTCTVGRTDGAGYEAFLRVVQAIKRTI